MRKPIIAGNWKMNKTPEEAKQLVTELVPLVKDAKCDVVVCTPAVCFAAVKPVIEGTNIKLGAQNVHFAEKGAYTGELSAEMLKASGCEYVIIGHSERRQYFGETDKTVNKRTVARISSAVHTGESVSSGLSSMNLSSTRTASSCESCPSFILMRKRSSCASGSGNVPCVSMGFCVATTRNGSSSLRVTPSIVTCRSSMHSRSADCVRGVARLISSASRMFVNTGPGLNTNSAERASYTLMPVTSPGSRSGVN